MSTHSKIGPIRQRILAATRRLLERDGLSRLTTKEVAKEAGCAEGSLFKYFPTKEKLLLTAAQEGVPIFRHNLAQLRGGSGKVPANLEDIAMSALRYYRKLVPTTVALFADGALLAQHRKTTEQQARPSQDIFGMVRGYIQAEQHQGRLSNEVPPDIAASLLLGACFHRVFEQHVAGEKSSSFTDRDFTVALVRTLLAGVLHSTPPGEDASLYRMLTHGGSVTEP